MPASRGPTPPNPADAGDRSRQETPEEVLDRTIGAEQQGFEDADEDEPSDDPPVRTTELVKPKAVTAEDLEPKPRRPAAGGGGEGRYADPHWVYVHTATLERGEDWWAARPTERDSHPDERERMSTFVNTAIYQHWMDRKDTGEYAPEWVAVEAVAAAMEEHLAAKKGELAASGFRQAKRSILERIQGEKDPARIRALIAEMEVPEDVGA